MERKTLGQRGMSLVEVTIILMVLAIVTAVIAPTLGNYVNDARRVKAQEDTEAIGLAIVQMLKDVGAPFPLISLTGFAEDRFEVANRVELLVSAGNTPGANGDAAVQDTTNGPVAARNWDDLIQTGVELLEDHVVLNTAGYTEAVPTPAATIGTIGWRGPYITKVANGDPWGYRYAVSTIYLGWATDADSGSNFGWNEDAIVISPGPNGRIETVFNHLTGGLAGDDIGMVISAATR